MKTPKTYTNEERLTLLRQYLMSGMTKQAFAREHDISPCSINQWLVRFGSPDVELVNQKLNEMKMPDDVEKLQEEVAMLRKQLKEKDKELERANLRSKAFETLVDLAESTYHIRVRKNSDAK